MNTTYFQRIASGRRTINSIRCIKVRDQLFFNDVDIGREARAFFLRLFTVGIWLGHVLLMIFSHISQRRRVWLLFDLSQGKRSAMWSSLLQVTNLQDQMDFLCRPFRNVGISLKQTSLVQCRNSRRGGDIIGYQLDHLNSHSEAWCAEISGLWSISLLNGT